MSEEIEYEEIDETYDTQMMVSLAEKQLAIQAELMALNKQVSDKEEELKKISKGQLPRAMNFLKMNSFSLTSGQGVLIKKHYFGSIKDNEEEAIEYLKEHELDDIVKNVITVEFPRGMEEMAETLFMQLQEMGYDAKNQKTIHASTLKSFIKERVEKKEELDDLYRFEMNKPVPETPDSSGWEEYINFARDKDMSHDALFPRDIFKVLVVQEAQIVEPKKRSKKR